MIKYILLFLLISTVVFANVHEAIGGTVTLMVIHVEQVIKINNTCEMFAEDIDAILINHKLVEVYYEGLEYIDTDKCYAELI
jgi:hypothetical protein